MRKTRQRQAIRDALEGADRPLSPAEIEELARADVAGINLATVYRNLKAMVDAGQVHVVEVLGRAARYELAGLGHHHHFLCEKCDRLFDLPPCPSGLLDGLAPPGFSVSGHELQLTGFCRTCA